MYFVRGELGVVCQKLLPQNVCIAHSITYSKLKFFSFLHFSPGFLRLHKSTAIMTAMMRRTIEATTIVIMMIRFEDPPYFNKPTPENNVLHSIISIVAKYIALTIIY